MFLEQIGYTCEVLDVGSHLREIIEGPETMTGNFLSKLMKEAKHVPEAFPVAATVEKLLKKNFDFFLADGIGRGMNELKMILDTLLKIVGERKISAVVINISEEEAKDHLLQRGREDDKEEIINARLASHRDHQMIIQDYLRSLWYLNYYLIDGNGTKKEVHQRILSRLSICPKHLTIKY